MADETTETIEKADEPGTGKYGDPKDKPKGDDTTSLMRQLLSALEKYGKPGEPSKGEEILPQLLLKVW